MKQRFRNPKQRLVLCTKENLKNRPSGVLCFGFIGANIFLERGASYIKKKTGKTKKTKQNKTNKLWSLSTSRNFDKGNSLCDCCYVWRISFNSEYCSCCLNQVKCASDRTSNDLTVLSCTMTKVKIVKLRYEHPCHTWLPLGCPLFIYFFSF